MGLITVQFEESDADFRQLVEYVRDSMRRHQVPGVAVGVLRDGRAFMAGLGVTSVENPLPVTADTLFQIGSTTKTVTGTAVMRLVEEGRLDLNAPVKRYVPELRLADPEAEASVTTGHLLTHMGGWAGDYFSDTGAGEDALARYVAEMAQLPQIVPLGTLWSYNNAGFALAGRVIEAVTGRPVESSLRELVLAPLGMDNSFFSAEDVISRRFVVGHQVEDDAGPAVKRPWALARSANAVGGLCSSVRDQLRYARFHLGDGTAAGGERVLSADTLKEMHRAHIPANLSREMGLSWILQRVAGTQLVTHGGATNGQLSYFALVPEHNFAVTLLTNAEEGGMLHDEAARWAFNHYLGLADPEPVYLERPTAELEPYLGVYDALLTRLELYLENGNLMMRSTPKGGFPHRDSPPSPAPPPSRVAFYEPDRLVALDPPLINIRAEFLRDADGRIAWLRTSRLHKPLPR